MKLLSGIQPTNTLHIGNYLGAVRNWAALQREHAMFAMVVDLHAITIPQKPAELRLATRQIVALYLALGLDPTRTTIFIQSHVPAHSELAWILSTIAKMGELERMTQFKDKSARFPDKVSVGLFTYPILMAADILLYDAEGVPVGEDQKQHVELARDLAMRFNKTFGEVFVIPKPLIQKDGGRIMGLDDPTKKMSKSGPVNSFIALTDTADVVRKKIARAVTDSGSEITASATKPALTNLLTIFSLLADRSIADLEKAYQGKTYSEFKRDLAEVIIAFLTPVQARMKEFDSDPSIVDRVLSDGAAKSRAVANATMQRVRDAVGLLSS